MPRLPLLTDDPDGLLERTRARLGRLPNLHATLANSPAALGGYLALHEHLGAGALTPRLREQLALLTAQHNECTYCVSAHTLRGRRLLGLSDEELARTRQAADDTDPHADAVLHLADRILHTRGRVTDEELATAREAGVTDAELAEITAHIALNTLSNYFNHLAQPVLDFPEVPA